MATLFTSTNSTEFWQHVVAEVTANLETKEQIHLATSGGSAANTLDYLPQELLRKSTVYLVDDRFVPETHADSNVAFVRGKLPESTALHSFPITSSRKESVTAYQTTLEQRLRDAGYLFDLTILGIGPDGHFASIFPHSNALKIIDTLTTTSETDMFAVRERVTLTIPAILSSKKIIVILIGSTKANVLTTLQKPETSIADFPAKALYDAPNVHIFWLNA